MASKYHPSVWINSFICNIILFVSNRNLKPDSIYLRGENNEENCFLVISDMVPPSVAYDIRMRTRLPRRMYDYYLLKKDFLR